MVCGEVFMPSMCAAGLLSGDVKINGLAAVLIRHRPDCCQLPAVGGHGALKTFKDSLLSCQDDLRPLCEIIGHGTKILRRNPQIDVHRDPRIVQGCGGRCDVSFDVVQEVMPPQIRLRQLRTRKPEMQLQPAEKLPLHAMPGAVVPAALSPHG